MSRSRHVSCCLRVPKRPTTILPANLICQQAQHGPKKKASCPAPRPHQSGTTPLNPQPNGDVQTTRRLQHSGQIPSLKTYTLTLKIDQKRDLRESRNRLLILISPTLQALNSSGICGNPTAKWAVMDKNELFYISIQTISTRPKQLQRSANTQFKWLRIAMNPSARRSQQPRRSSYR